MKYIIETLESPKYLIHYINEKNYKHLCNFSIEIIKFDEDGKERKEDKISLYDH